ncbi:hypothetical protein N7445_010113 [Penicillium cf. griseofulvum]|nr:hypothetical protein N7445_010113 [Penicillium cf. griseofulvum]
MRDTLARSVHTEQKLSIEGLENTSMAKIKAPVITPELAMPEKCLASLEPRNDMDKGLWRDGIENRIRNLEERLWRSELQQQQDIVQERTTSLEEQVSMRDFVQQHSRLKERLAMHEKLLEISNQLINKQQEHIQYMGEAQAITNRKLALTTQMLPQPKQFVQQPQVEEPEGRLSNSGGVNKSTDASGYVFV